MYVYIVWYTYSYIYLYMHWYINICTFTKPLRFPWLFTACHELLSVSREGCSTAYRRYTSATALKWATYLLVLLTRCNILWLAVTSPACYMRRIITNSSYIDLFQFKTLEHINSSIIPSYNCFRSSHSQ